MKKRVSLLMAAILLLTGCANTQNSKQKVKIVLDWTPNTNHIGLYVAKALGYFEQYDIEVEIVQPNQSSSIQLVAANQAQLGISYQEEVSFALTATPPLPIKAVATILQHNTSGFASMSDSGILTPKDFENKTYGMYGSASEKAVIKELMNMYNADDSKVNMVLTNESDFFKLVPEQVDFTWIFEGWTGVQAELEGIKLNYIPLNTIDEKFDYYTPVIITNSEFEKNPELLKNTLSAIAQGYEFTVQNPQKAAQILCEEVPTLDKSLVEKSTYFLNNYFLDENMKFGTMRRSVWELYSQWLYENKLIPTQLKVDEAFSNEYLQ